MTADVDARRGGAVAWLTWAVVGVLGVVGLIGPSYSIVYVVPLAIAIIAPFVLWGRMGGRPAFAALATLGIGMAAILGYAWANQIGCPAGTAQVVLKDGKAPVDCAQIIASYRAFTVFFAIVGFIGIAGPFMPAGEPDIEDEVA